MGQGLEAISLFDGLLDDVRIYDRALAAGEVAGLADAVLNNPLVGHWSFDDNSANTTVIDRSGNGNDGIARQNTVDMSSTGVIADALNFDGINDYVDCGNDPSLDLTENLSIGLWFYARNWDTPYPSFISARDSYSSLDWQLFYNSGFNRIEFYYGNAGAYKLFYGLNVNPSLETWHHLFVARQGDTWSLYLDGVLQGTNIQSGAMPTGDNIRIGIMGQGLEAISLFDGLLDDVRIYGQALTAGEVAELADVSFNSDFIGHWRMDDNEPNAVVIDSSGNGNDGLAQQNTVDLSYTGAIADALNFDGINDYVDCGSDPSFVLTEDLSIGLWFYARNWDAPYPSFISARESYSSMDWQLFYNSGFNRIEFYYGNLGAYKLYYGLNVNPSLETWHHLFVTRQGDTWSLYLDGVLQGTNIQSEAMPTGDNIRIGIMGQGLEAISLFDGLIDEVKIYGKALSSADVGNLYGEGEI
jgi:hypothetical protein